VHVWARSVLFAQPGGNAGPIEERRLPLEPGGTEALFVSDPSLRGTGGNLYLVFAPGPRGFRYLGCLDFGVCRPAPPGEDGRPRLVTYWHMSASEGVITIWRLTEEGFEPLARSTLRAGDGGTEEGNRLYGALFGVEAAPAEAVGDAFGGTTTP
jgi:hypothetical protein